MVRGTFSIKTIVGLGTEGLMSQPKIMAQKENIAQNHQKHCDVL